VDEQNGGSVRVQGSLDRGSTYLEGMAIVGVIGIAAG
jgi:hypothetical protein